ncbi:ImmA/IrrE family metallo-endopeptidase [Sinorhizobium meliloti]|uniref:ImmA/IrrE family metallo-endopeptidase n=1 Tax=Rhizobium meliloti TaxID=382 RepID=UPI001F391BDA|nr:ImmA/IrrE family metallo-endopeptidase [Sinorhizobium meliloti]
MTTETQKLRQQLRRSGLSEKAIDAAWPAWWSDELEASPSSRAELRFTLARKLGLSPKPLLGERVEFIWRDRARFKHLAAGDDVRQDAITSFGVSVAKLLIKATAAVEFPPVRADELRSAVLSQAPFVDLRSLVTICWGLGIPVIHLRVFPLDRKSMHAMVVEDQGRYAVLLGRDSQYPAPIAFTLAHELGHVMLGHLHGTSAIVDLEESEYDIPGDPQEDEADTFAISLLTGSANPEITANVDNFGPKALAQAVLDAGPRHGIEPGTLALCLAHRMQKWPAAMAALQHIYTAGKPVWQEVNGIANSQLRWAELSDDSAGFLENVMLGPDA